MFIAFEGGDGSGKSTQAALLAQRLQTEGYDVFLVQDPGTTAVGKKLRELLLDKTLMISPWTQALMFTAARAETATLIKAHRDRGGIVVADRWIFSTRVYQGHAQGVDYGLLDAVTSARFMHGQHPDCTIVLDVEVQSAALRRIHRQSIGACAAPSQQTADRFESAAVEFHEKLRAGYRFEASRTPTAVLLEVEGFSKEVVHDMVLEAVAAKMPTLLGHVAKAS